MDKRLVRLYDVNYIDLVDGKSKCKFELTITQFNVFVVKSTIMVESCTSYFATRDIQRADYDTSYTIIY